MSIFDLSQHEGENTKYKPLLAGERVPVTIKKVVFEEDDNALDVYFQGTQSKGSLKVRFWGNDFDASSDRYVQVNAERKLNQITHIVKAYFTDEETGKIKGDSWVELGKAVANALNEKAINVPAELKVLLNVKDEPVLPLFPDFISTDFRKNVLKVNSTINASTGKPYENVTYGTNAAPAGNIDPSAPAGNIGVKPNNGLPF